MSQVLPLYRNKQKQGANKLAGDVFGGLTAMLVALPSAIAYALIVYAPLGPELTGQAAFSGILGTFALGLVAALFGGTPRLISAPCAPAAAVLSVFTTGLVAMGGDMTAARITLMVSLSAVLAGFLQFLAGRLGGGKIIKYIPYPVVAGYLSGVGLIILTGQLPKLLGSPKELPFLDGLLNPNVWQWQGIVVGLVTMTVMVLAPRLVKKIPAAIVALLAGIGIYFILGLFDQQLLNLEHNKMVIGTLPAPGIGFFENLGESWLQIRSLEAEDFMLLVVPVFTLMALLSIDTLKTCVILDVLTHSRHNSNRELLGQGLGNLAAGLLGGMPGAGTMGATMVNLTSGGTTRRSSVFAGILALVVALIFLPIIAWIPVASLAGILIVLGLRMIDRHSINLLKHRSTVFDFVVILAVIVAALATSLIVASGVGIALAIVLFLRDQMRSSVVRRKMSGDKVFSRKSRSSEHLEILGRSGTRTMVFDIQGQLFFGTSDQLYTELEPYFKTSRFLVLNMRNVQSVDYTAVNMIKQIRNQLKVFGGTLVLASVPRSLPTGLDAKKYLAELGLTDESSNLRFCADLDGALEFCEDELIREQVDGLGEEEQDMEVEDFELFRELPMELLVLFRKNIEARIYEQGEAIFSRGDTGRELYLIRSGEVKIVLPMAQGQGFHLATFNRGAFFGDMAFLDNETRSADARAESRVSLYILRREAFDDLARSNPEAALKFFETLSRVISRRLRKSHSALMTLQDS